MKKELEKLCFEQTGRDDLCNVVAHVLTEIAETCRVRAKISAAILPCGPLRSAVVTVIMARDGAVAVLQLHGFYLVVEIAEAGVLKYYLITPEYDRRSN